MKRFRQLMLIVFSVFVAAVLVVLPAGGAFPPPPDFLSPPDTIIVLADPGQDAGDPARAGGDPDSLAISDRSRLLLFPSSLENFDTKLVFSVRRERPANGLMGYEIYRASRMQCTIQGVSAGASLGLMAGAFGEMMGAWNENTSWCIGGAMAAFGALYGGKIKADDDGWSLQIKWDEDRPNKGIDQDR